MDAKNLSELKIGQEQYIDVLVQNIKKMTARNGTPYERLTIRDNNGNEACVLNWGTPFTQELPAVIRLRVMTEEYQESPSYRMMAFEESSEKKENFLPKAQINMRETWKELTNIIKTIRPDLMQIASGVLMENQKRFLYLPLSEKDGYARQCGILEATAKLVKLAYYSAETLDMDKDLAAAAASLYYIGATLCMDSSFLATPDDILLGSGLASYSKVFEWASKNGKTDSADFKLLCHILVSRNKGIATAIPEALLLRHLDAVVTGADSIQAELNHAEPGTITKVYGYGKYYAKK